MNWSDADAVCDWISSAKTIQAVSGRLGAAMEHFRRAKGYCMVFFRIATSDRIQQIQRMKNGRANEDILRRG